MKKRSVAAMAIGVALVLLGACAWQSQATVPPAGMQVAAETLAPTGVPVSVSDPRPTPWLEAASDAGIYTAAVRSPGLDLSRSTVSTGMFSSSVAPLGIEGAGADCTRMGRDVRCDLGDLQAGDAATVTLDLNVPAAGTLISGTVAPAEATTIVSATDLVVQASGPSTVLAGQPVTYTYTISNRGEFDATGVRFEDAVPSDMNLVAYAPRLPDCDRAGDALTCVLRGPGGGQAITFTLIVTGYGEQPMVLAPDPLQPGWPICTVLKERTWLHIVQCELGDLKPGQATHVQLVLTAIGVVERTTANAASVRANEADLNPSDNTITTTIAVQTGATPGEDTPGGE